MISISRLLCGNVGPGDDLRVRAEAVYGDALADDHACYLTDEEIGLAR